jgi:hypothetical protein
VATSDMTPGQVAEALIAELGIRAPAEIDVDAIADDAGVEVVYAALDGCEATLMGYKGRATATVRPNSVRGRERFSVAHELGHWTLHRGRSFRCRVEEPDQNLQHNREAEKQADSFASHLLMPSALFNPAIAATKRPGFKELGEVARAFDTSMMATAIRLANINTLPVIVANYGKSGRRWHIAAGDVPRRWWLRDVAEEESFAYDLLHEGRACQQLRKQSADVWFANDDAGEYEVLEQCIPSSGDTALVLIYLASEDMMFAKFDPGVGRRYTASGSYVPRRSTGKS